MWHLNIPCANCGMAFAWTKKDLENARERLLKGDHAAPACCDDCANKSEPWNLDDLNGLIDKSNTT